MFDQYEDILSVVDVADALCIGKNRVYDLLTQKKLKGFQIGHVWKIPRESVINYVKKESGL